MKLVLRPSFDRLVRRVGVVLSAFGLTFAAASARAEVVTGDLVNPDNPDDIWGQKITGLGDNGDETALVFTKTGETMSWTLDKGVTAVRFLAVGGGGGGGGGMNNAPAGGGGAGGLARGTMCDLLASTVVAIEVGAGGTGGAARTSGAGNDGTRGGSSQIAVGETTYVMVYGGGGGAGHSKDGVAGACGGGAGGFYSSGACGSGGSIDGYSAVLNESYVSGETYGNVGGNGYSGKAYGAGGGGATAAGGNATSSKAGSGGAGLSDDITGAPVTYAAGGAGVAGAWSGSAPEPAANNTGNGGKGATNKKDGGNGGSGIVVIRYREMAANEIPVPTIEGKTYTGELQKADIADGEGYVVTKNEGGIDAGDYEVILTLVDGYRWVGGSTAPAKLTFTIAKAENVWTTEPSLSKTAWELADDPAIVNAGAALSETAVVVTYDEGVTEMPLTVGDHTAVFTVEESQNYLGIEKTIGYTISKNTNGWIVEPSMTKTTWAFDEKPGEIVMGEAKYDDVVVTYDDNPEITKLPTDKGSHTVKFTVAETDTYTGLEKVVDYTVTKKQHNWIVPPNVPATVNIEDGVNFPKPVAEPGVEVKAYFDGDPEKTELTELSVGESHSVTYEIAGDDDWDEVKQTFSFKVTYKPIVDPADPSKVFGYRIPKLGENQDEVALVFTNTGYTVNNPMCWTLPQAVTTIDYLVVGGGASGGASYNSYGGGGGGAGGVATNNAPVAIAQGTILEVAVGAGGAAVKTSRAKGKDGAKSSLTFESETVLALPGAGGSSGNEDGVGGKTTYACGGGAGGYTAAHSGGEGAISNGGASGANTGKMGGGGGGAGGDGGNAVAAGGLGGSGVGVTIFGGGEIRIAGGGSGSPNTRVNGPTTDGGGRGAFSDSNYGGPNATAGTSWGAGGGGATGNTCSSGAGHQGVVVVRYVEPAGVVMVPTILPKTYTGETLVADVPVNVGYTVTENDGGTDVDDYDVVLTLNDGYRWDGGSTEPTNLAFTITQAQNEWTVEPSIDKTTWLTTDDPGELTAGETKFGTPTVTISKDGGDAEPFDGTLPTAAGQYVITYTAPETTDNYLAPEITAKTVEFTIVGAEEMPDFTVVFNGELTVGFDTVVTATVPYRVSCEVTSPKTVTVCAKVTEAGSDTTNTIKFAENVALDGSGIGVLDDLKPGATYFVSLYGEGEGKVSPETEAATITTPGPASDLEASATFTNDPMEFILTGSVKPGLGTTKVTVRWSINSTELDQSAVFTFAQGDDECAFSESIPYSDYRDWLQWDVIVENSFRGQEWQSSLPSKKTTRKDQSTVIYAWNGEDGGSWLEPANWTPSKTPCFGYPDGDFDRVSITKATTIDLGGASIDLDTTVNQATFELAAGKTVTLTNGSVMLPSKQIKSNCHLCLKDGGTVNTEAEETVFAQQTGYNGVLELAGNATVQGGVNAYTYDTDAHKDIGNTILVRGENNKITGSVMNQSGRMLVDVREGSLDIGGMDVWLGGVYPLELSVSNASVKVGSFGIRHAASQTTNRRKFDVFVPAGGLAEAPITITTQYDLTTAAYFEIKADPSFGGGSVPLIKGIKSIPDVQTLIAHTTYDTKHFSGITYSLKNGVLSVKLKGVGFALIVK